MADLSKITLPNNTTVNLKDNSQVNSDHRHYGKDIVPLVHKLYESTSYYATTAGDWTTASWYFMSVKPDSWYLPWRVKLKVHSYCPNYQTYESYTWSTICGRSDGMIYANWNERQDAAHYYLTAYPLKKAGFDAGYGHALGVSILYGGGYTTASYYRTFELDYYECENCTVTILDTPVKWDSWAGSGTTNYNNINAFDAVNRGLKETGDDNTITENRITYFAGKTGTLGIWANALFMEDAFGKYQNICTASDGTVTANSRTTATTKLPNPNGFKVLGTIWYCNTTYAANTDISGSSVVYSATSIFDTRFSFNTALTANFLTPYAPVYLVGTVHDDGLFYLDNPWWTQTPTDTSKLYVLVGGVYDSTTTSCRVTLYEQNKWYRYDGTNLIEIANEAISATSLVSSVVSTADIEPYNFRKSGKDLTAGNREIDTIIGGSIAWNQLIDHSSLPSTSQAYTHAGITYVTNSNNSITITGKLTSGAQASYMNVCGASKLVVGHKYFFDITGNTWIRSWFSGTPNLRSSTASIFTISTLGTGFYVIADSSFVGDHDVNETINIYIIDLTQMFGSTIADYLYSCEQSTVGSGVALIKNLFPKSYYAYDSGSLMSVKTSAHKMVGFNAWDEEWELGSIGDNDGQNVPTNTVIRSTNYIPALADTMYYCYLSGKNTHVFCYDANYNYLGYRDRTGNGIITTILNTSFIRFRMNTAYGTTYNNDICINISNSKNGTYEPYSANEYELDADLELRGIPKLDANNKFYYDGDTYESDGTVTRKCGFIEFDGSDDENWTYTGTRFICPISDMLSQASRTYVLSNRGVFDASSTADGTIFGFNGSIYYYLSTITTLAEFKTWLSNHHLQVVYPLATPTTEEADAYQNPQIVDDFGTEEYVDTRSVAIPVGHNTVYYAYDDRAKLDSLPDSAVVDGTYAISQVGGDQTLVSTSAISVGDAETVNGHTVESDVPSNAVFTDTTYTFTGGANGFTVTSSGGIAQSVMVTPSIANNITGSGTSGYLTKFNGTNKITNGPQLGSDTTKYLRNDGTWQVPPNDDTKVRQTLNTENNKYPLLMSYALTSTSTANIDNVSYRNSSIYANPAEGSIVATTVRAGDTYYGISYGKSTSAVTESILYTGIQWISSTHMPVIHLRGYAFSNSEIVDLQIGFYIYNNNIGWCGVSNCGAWAPEIYAFKYTKSSVDYVAIGLKGSINYLLIQVDISDGLNKFGKISTTPSDWTWTFTSTATIPTPDSGVTCIKATYTADILKDTKNTAGATDTSSKIFLIGATEQSANPQTYSDDHVYVTNGTLTANNVVTPGVLCVSQETGGSGGISLYSGTSQVTNYGIAMRTTTNSGKHGYVQGDWANYFYFNGATNRGWVYKQAGAAIASISGEGHAVFNGSVTIGGNATNTSGARLVYDANTQAINFEFL